jgi:hypothetical protein
MLELYIFLDGESIHGMRDSCWSCVSPRLGVSAYWCAARRPQLGTASSHSLTYSIISSYQRVDSIFCFVRTPSVLKKIKVVLTATQSLKHNFDSYSYKNIYQKMICVYFYESIFKDKSMYMVFIFPNSTT